jgi:DNA-directed RNA polymerase subunit L
MEDGHTLAQIMFWVLKCYEKVHACKYCVETCFMWTLI